MASTPTASTTSVTTFEAGRIGLVAATLAGRLARFTRSVSAFARFGLVAMMTTPVMELGWRWFAHHENLLETLLHIRRVFLEALIDGRLRFGFGLGEELVRIGVFRDLNGAIVRGFPLSVAFLRHIRDASLHHLFFTIADHRCFRTRLDRQHTTFLQFHLLAAWLILSVDCRRKGQNQ
jgi:hypothetical protein